MSSFPFMVTASNLHLISHDKGFPWLYIFAFDIERQEYSSSFCLPSFQVLSILCAITLFPSNVPSHDLGNERRSNETKPSLRQSSSLLPRFHKHRIKNNKPAVYTKEASPITLTQRPTNSRRIRLFGRVGLFLHCNANGTVSGSLNRHSSYGKYFRLSEFIICFLFFFCNVYCQCLTDY